MSENFNDKDYAEYFRVIESKLTRQNVVPQQTEATPPKVSKAKPKGKRTLLTGVVAIALAVVITVISVIAVAGKKDGENEDPVNTDVQTNTVIERAMADSKTREPSAEIESKNIIVINLDSKKIVAKRSANERVFPASTTKIMTMLVACEQAKDFSETFTMPIEITDAVFLEGATAAGFKIGEEVSITDMLYGCILPSGADAALGLAYKISGSEEAFVELMNKKSKELRLEDTHFTNVTGLHNEQHYTTAADMAVILQAAMQNSFCRKILSTYEYTTSKTEQNPEGIIFTSTLFGSMYGTEPQTAQILGGKTGFVNESGYCIASYGEANGGDEYICVTMGASSLVPAVNDQIALYKEFAK